MSNEIAVPDEGGQNIIYIRAGKMPWGIKNKVQGLALRVGVKGTSSNTEVDLAALNAALLLNNIIRWEGPALAGFTLTEAGLDRLDPDHGDAVLAAISAQNPQKASPNPKSPAAST